MQYIDAITRNVIRMFVEANRSDLSISWLRTLLREQHEVTFKGNAGEWISFVEKNARAVGARVEVRGRARYIVGN